MQQSQLLIISESEKLENTITKNKIKLYIFIYHICVTYLNL